MEKDSLISDFPFIAHDATITTKRQIPTFVRAHVMERYHRERRAKKGIKDAGNPVWSQHEFVAPDRNGQVLRWEEEDGKDTAASSKAKTVKPRKKKAVTQQLSKAKAASPPKEMGWEDSYAVSIVRKRSESPEVKLEDLVDFKRLVALHVHRSNDVRSLMPKDEMEEGGMQLVRILDDYYGVLGEVGHESDPWHTMWLPFAFSDRALFHASLSKFSVHFAASCGTMVTSADLLRHKGMAMENLSITIADASIIPTDTMIATAICLIGTELLNSDQSALRFHVRGVRRMIAMRGGMSGLITDPILIGGYLSYEYILAVLEVEMDPELLKELSVPTLHELHFPSQTGIFSFARKKFDPTNFGFSQDTVSFLSALCEYLAISDVFARPENEGVDSVGSLETLIRKIDQREIQRALKSVPSRSNEDHVLQALLLTSALQFPQLATTSRIRNADQGERLRQLQYHITRSPSHNYWRPLPGALLWCLMVGTSKSKGIHQRGFFLANLVRATCGLAFTSCEPVRIALAIFYKLAQDQKEIASAFSNDIASTAEYV